MNDHLSPVGKPGAAAAAQARGLHHVDDRPRGVMPSAFSQRLVAAALHPAVERARLGVAEVLREDDRLLRVARMRIAHYVIPLRGCAGTFSGVTDSMKSSLIMIGVAKPQAPRHSTSITVNRPSGLVAPSSLAAGVLEQRLDHVLGAADVAGRRGADLDEVPADRMLVVHRVERHHALHVRRRELEHLRHLGHGRLR